MPIGDIFSKLDELNVSTADDKEFKIKLTQIKKLGLRIIGVPHLGFRGRASLILKFLNKIEKNDLVLDAGCGYGFYSLTLSKKWKEVYALDLEKERIDELNKIIKTRQEFSGIKTFEGSLTNIPFKEKFFDLILCSEVLEHIKEDKKALSELSRVLKQGGYLILSFPTNSRSNKKEYKKFHHERHGYDRKAIEELARKNGLVVIEIKYYEYSLGNLLFRIHNKFSNLVLTALFFYPFYALFRLDNIIKTGEPNGQIVLFQKK